LSLNNFRANFLRSASNLYKSSPPPASKKLFSFGAFSSTSAPFTGGSLYFGNMTASRGQTLAQAGQLFLHWPD
jgi:hypothetical protein